MSPQAKTAKTVGRPILGIAAVLLGASLATLFGRLLSVGIGDLRGALKIDADSGAWIGTTYNMGLMFVGPFSTYLGGLLGPRRVLLATAVIFTVLCGVMPLLVPFPVLIALLALSGLTAGTFYPLTLSFILRNLPPKYLHYGIAAYAIDIVVTTHIAHSYEGWLIRSLSWHWIFWTTAVLTPVMIALVLFGIPSQPIAQPQPGQPTPSWRGFFYASLGAALLYGALDQGQRLDWWRSGTFVAMVVSGSFLILAAVVRHFYRPNPLVNFTFLRRRNTLLLSLVVIVFRFVLLASVVLIPSYLAAVKGYRPEQTGHVLLWLAVPQFLAGLLAVYLLGHVDARLIVSIGFALIAVGCLMDAQISSAWSGTSFDMSQLVLALGEGFAFNGMVGSIVLDILNSGEMTNPSAVLSFGGFFQTIRLFGGEAGSVFIQFSLQSRQVLHFDTLSSRIQGASPAAIARGRGLDLVMHARSTTPDLATARAAILFVGSIRQQAFTLAIMDCFILIACAATGCLFLLACLRPLKTGFKQIIAASNAGKSA